ncbi:MAG: MFS transporter, partial [Arthrobacter sp.]
MKTHNPQGTAMKRRAALASGVGAVMDWYDFFLYGIASALVFNKVFFPSFDSTAGTIASFGT